jgi:hypothetical protein
VLGPAVEAEDDIVALPRFGDVEAQAAGLDPAVADAVDRRRLADARSCRSGRRERH